MNKESALFDLINNKVRHYTVTNKKRQRFLHDSILNTHSLEGDCVETGVFKGGSSMIMALTLQNIGQGETPIWLYDTYEGMPMPNSSERKLNDSQRTAREIHSIKTATGEGWCKCSLGKVKTNMQKQTGYDNLIFVKGMVEDTLKTDKPTKIRVLRLDTDFYESTKAGLEYLYPLVELGGYVLIDDYNAFSGCKQAVNEYFNDTIPKLEYADPSAIGFIKWTNKK